MLMDGILVKVTDAFAVTVIRRGEGVFSFLTREEGGGADQRLFQGGGCAR